MTSAREGHQEELGTIGALAKEIMDVLHVPHSDAVRLAEALRNKGWRKDREPAPFNDSAYWRGYDDGERHEYDRQLRVRESLEDLSKRYSAPPVCTCWKTGLPLNPVAVDPACPTHRIINTTFTTVMTDNTKD